MIANLGGEEVAEAVQAFADFDIEGDGAFEDYFGRVVNYRTVSL